MVIKRLQGPDWANFRRHNKLKLVAIGKSSNDNYVSYVTADNNLIVRHWLGDSEVEKLKSSGWLENNKVYDCNDLYNTNLLKALANK